MEQKKRASFFIKDNKEKEDIFESSEDYVPTFEDFSDIQNNIANSIKNEEDDEFIKQMNNENKIENTETITLIDDKKEENKNEQDLIIVEKNVQEKQTNNEEKLEETNNANIPNEEPYTQSDMELLNSYVLNNKETKTEEEINEKIEKIMKSDEGEKKDKIKQENEKEINEILNDKKKKSKLFNFSKKENKKKNIKKDENELKNEKNKEKFSFKNILKSKNKKETNNESVKQGNIKKEEIKETQFLTQYEIDTRKENKWFKYPKYIEPPVDKEYIEEKRQMEHFWNLNKYLEYKKWNFIKYIRPLYYGLDKLTFQQLYFDEQAEKLFQKVDKYNKMTATQQKLHDIKKWGFRVGVVCGFVVIFFAYNIIFVYPNENYKQAINNIQLGNYEKAYETFDKLGSLKNSQTYKIYTQGKLLLADKQYEKAEEAFTYLLDYQNLFPKDIIIEDEIKEVKYVKAIELFTNNKFDEATEIFKEIHNYKEATNFYYKIHYKIANDFFENGEYEEALKTFAKIPDYEDAGKRYNELGEQFYNVAKEQYSKKEYEVARENFKLLADLNYKDSKEFFTQCSYKFGVESFERGAYLKAIETFEDIQEYKDSYAIQKEAQYKYSKNLYNSNHMKSIGQFEKIKKYKDVDKFLNSHKLVLYGKWKVISMNDINLKDTEFIFNEQNELISDKQLTNVALSTDATSRHYEYAIDGLVFENYKLFIVAEDYNNIKMTAQFKDKRVTYNCTRLESYSDMSKLKDIENNELLETDFELSLRHLIKQKTDGNLTGQETENKLETENKEEKDTLKEEVLKDKIENTEKKENEEVKNIENEDKTSSLKEQEELEEEKKNLKPIFENKD